MITIATPVQQRHDPPIEFLEGRLGSYTEAPLRATMILEALQQAAIGPIIEPRDFGLEPILAVHSAEYLEHLRTIYQRWRAAGFPESGVLPSCLPVRELQHASPALHAQIGYYAFDLSAPVVEHTYTAALAAAQSALTGAALLLEGERFAYALCRPPGHHAHRELMGGFCYLNNAAIAADYLTREVGGQGQTVPRRVALLDIDVHAGNGSQHIFYERADVLFVSIHGDPSWEYPYFAGFADEHGAGAGEGFTINYPLSQGTADDAYLAVLDDALDKITAFAPAYLVLSAGFDAFDGDPLGKFKLTTAGFAAIGKRVADRNLPTLIVQEGGYSVAALGQNVLSLLRGIEG